jgi:hypothetical protein
MAIFRRYFKLFTLYKDRLAAVRDTLNHTYTSAFSILCSSQKHAFSFQFAQPHDAFEHCMCVTDMNISL